MWYKGLSPIQVLWYIHNWWRTLLSSSGSTTPRLAALLCQHQAPPFPGLVVNNIQSAPSTLDLCCAGSPLSLIDISLPCNYNICPKETDCIVSLSRSPSIPHLIPKECNKAHFTGHLYFIEVKKPRPRELKWAAHLRSYRVLPLKVWSMMSSADITWMFVRCRISGTTWFCWIRIYTSSWRSTSEAMSVEMRIQMF